MHIRALGVTATTLAMIAVLPNVVSAAWAHVPTGMIGPDRLHALLLTDEEVHAALPPTIPAFEMNGGLCEKLQAAATFGLGRLNYCQNTITSESMYAHEQNAGETYPSHVNVTSFPNAQAAKKGLAEQLRVNGNTPGTKLSGVSSAGFTSSNQSYKVTTFFALKGSNLVETECTGQAAPARLACAKALSAAQKRKLP